MKNGKINCLMNLWLLLLLLVFAKSISSQELTDKAALLKDVGTFYLYADTVPAIVTYPIGYDAQVIASGNIAQGTDPPIYAPVIITGRLGKGKILVIGNAHFLSKTVVSRPDVHQFWKNVFHWAPGQRMAIGFSKKKLGELNRIAGQQHLIIRHITGNRIPPGVRTLFLNDIPEIPGGQEMISDFIKNGGALIYLSSAWEVLKKNGYHLDRIPGNQLLTKAGLFHFGDIVSGAPDDTLYTGPAPDYLKPQKIIPNIRNYQYIPLFYDKGTGRIPLSILKLIYYWRDSSTAIRKDLVQSVSGHEFDSIGFPGLKQPLYTAYWPDVFRLFLRVAEDERKAGLDPHHRSANNKEFPGIVPDHVSRVTERIEIVYSNRWSGLPEPDTSFKRWHSTGLYVAPGDLVEVVLDRPVDTSRHIEARIGIHEDDVTNAETYLRNPFDLVKSFNLDRDTVRIHSLYGGLLYFNIPVTDSANSFKAAVTGAVHAPYFQLGKTSNKEWVTQVKNYEAPWAELASNKIILTVPSDSIRNLQDPEKLMRFWDAVMDANADLAQIPRDRWHPERIIIDNNVAYGYMYTTASKIVAPNDRSLSMLLNERYLRDSGSWGHFHEIGHRHQFFGIDFDELGEVTVNLYTLYAYRTVLGKDIYQSRDGATRDSIHKLIRDYIHNPDYSRWRNDPFLQLYTLFYPIIDAYGWDAIKQMNRSSRKIYEEKYKGTNISFKRAADNNERRNAYFVLLSKAIGVNLSSYFDKLKIPVSDDAKKQVAGLPVWMPDLFK
ncbi:M60 family metallopeptidase [Niabella sp.]|uniref:M60 family metallopeptidase n=1 Tax=Niabella sp. TaxID=1962976 RepID=UPI00261B137E|nr:M60 family metallopeptidase [Niabella sp.]